MAPPLPDLSPTELRDSFFARRTGRRVHQAIDIMRPEGTPLYACIDGFVEQVSNSRLGGLAIYLSDATGKHRFYYAHLSAYAEDLVEGMPVLRGQLIGYVGSTGNARATGPHLHFQILQARRAVNPFPVLRHVVDSGVQSVQTQEVQTEQVVPPAPVAEILPPAPVPVPAAALELETPARTASVAAPEYPVVKPVKSFESVPLVTPDYSITGDGR
jgi:peptidoglycan LD-endopeptidase LytH